MLRNEAHHCEARQTLNAARHRIREKRQGIIDEVAYSPVEEGLYLGDNSAKDVAAYIREVTH